jgi:hypothetical protein
VAGLSRSAPKKWDAARGLSIVKMPVDSNIVLLFGAATQALSSAMQLAAFKIRTQRYLQVIFRMFSM